MGVRWFPCDRCSRSICDCGEWVSCNDDCGRDWCDDECAEKDGRRTDGNCENPTCNFCRCEDATDDLLFNFLMKRVGLTRDDVVRLYFKHKGKP